jgi:hypothetical protein
MAHYQRVSNSKRDPYFLPPSPPFGSKRYSTFFYAKACQMSPKAKALRKKSSNVNRAAGTVQLDDPPAAPRRLVSPRKQINKRVAATSVALLAQGGPEQRRRVAKRNPTIFNLQPKYTQICISLICKISRSRLLIMII